MVTTAERHRFQLIQCFREFTRFKTTWLINDLAEESSSDVDTASSHCESFSDCLRGNSYLQSAIKLGIPAENTQNKMVCCCGM